MAVHKDKAIGRRDLSGNLDAAVPVAGLSGGVARVIDVVGASIGLLFFGPILPVVALAIKLKSPGPVLVCEVQYGSRTGGLRCSNSGSCPPILAADSATLT